VSDLLSFLFCNSHCPQTQALVELWSANGKSVVEKLKQRCLAPKQVKTKDQLGSAAMLHGNK